MVNCSCIYSSNPSRLNDKGIKLFSDAKLTKFFTFTLFLLSRTLMLKSPTKQRFLLFLRIISKIGFKEFLNFFKTRIRWPTNLTKNDIFFLLVISLESISLLLLEILSPFLSLKCTDSWIKIQKLPPARPF